MELFEKKAILHGDIELGEEKAILYAEKTPHLETAEWCREFNLDMKVRNEWDVKAEVCGKSAKIKIQGEDWITFPHPYAMESQSEKVLIAAALATAEFVRNYHPKEIPAKGMTAREFVEKILKMTEAEG